MLENGLCRVRAPPQKLEIGEKLLWEYEKKEHKYRFYLLMVQIFQLENYAYHKWPKVPQCKTKKEKWKSVTNSVFFLHRHSSPYHYLSEKY